MKKLAIVITILALSASGFAQSSKINNAFQDYRRGKIAKALEAIEEAAVHPDTKDQARTWFYRGNIYYKIAASPDSTINTLRANALDTAYASYQKAITMDAGISNDMLDIASPIIGSQFCASLYFNRGLASYQNQKFNDAFADFDKTNRIKTDNGAMYMAALAAMYIEKTKPQTEKKNYKSAKQYFNNLISGKYNEPNIFIFLSDIYKDENDTTRAISTINNGEKVFADTSRIMIQKFNIYLWAGQTKVALDLLQKIKDKEPNNAIVYFNIGTVLNDMGNFEEAVKAYERAIELNPEYFDALFNFGTVYFNKFLKMKEAADKLPIDQQAQYDTMIKEANGYLVKARPYLEKCRTLNDKDYDTLYMLKQVYTRMGEKDKANEVDAKMKEIRG